MHLRRYRSQTVDDALAQAKAELGPNARVVSTQLVSERGWRGWLGQRVVELAAASDRDMSAPGPLETPPESPRLPRQEAPPLIAPLRPVAEGESHGNEALAAKLQAAGLGRRIADDVASAVPRAARHLPSDLLRRAIADALEAITASDDGFSSIEVFIGPPGVGKTTTVAKIAAQERALRGRRLGLIAADGFRAGAVDQLRLYAEIIGSPFVVARSAAELDAALRVVRSSTVLVDTAGRSPHDAEAQALFAVLRSHPSTRTHLVMSAATTFRDASRMLDAYEAARPARVVLTRLDETDSCGPLLDVFRERHVAVSYLGCGQRVPEDLTRATALALAAHVLGESPGQIGEDA